ncbi:MAG TPA: hypothetical protein VF940_22460 [Streptosporangiaceae bacterium]
MRVYDLVLPGTDQTDLATGRSPAHGRPATDQARFELALPDHLDHGAAGKTGGPVLRHHLHLDR